jgi:hypothetical protein
MERRASFGIVALVNPESPYQTTVSLWAVGTFLGLLVLSAWIYLHWVWARDRDDLTHRSASTGPRIVLVAGEARTTQGRTTQARTTQGRTTQGRAVGRGPRSVADLLADDPQVLADGLHQKLIELGLLSDVVVALEEGMATEPMGGAAGQGFDVVRQVADALAAYLGEPLGELVAAAWYRHPEVRAMCVRTVGRGAGTRQVVVGHYVLESVHRPTVVLDVGGARTPLLDVVLSVALTVDGIAIGIAHGEVVATAAGEASCRIDLVLGRPGGPSHTVLSEQNASLVLPAYRRPDADAESAGVAAVGIPGARRRP